MALKGVIQGPGGTGGGQLSGSGVTSVALSGPAPFITGPPVTSAGTLTFDFSGTPIPVADGGTGMGSFAANSLITAGTGSSSPFQSKPFPGTSSTFLDGTGAFSVPAGGGGGGAGTVTSVDLSMSSEFRISGNPVTNAGTLVAGFIQALNVGHGGTGMGSFGPSVVMGGLNSTAPLQGRPLTNLSSTFLDGTGNFSTPPTTPTGGTGTVTSVDLSPPPEFTVSGNPITTAGTITLSRISPSSVSAGGTGVGSFTSNALIQAGLSSTGSFRSLPLNQQTSTYLDGTGTFRIIPYPPSAGTGTVTSVDIAVPPGFTVSGDPITTSGTMTIGVISPSSVSAGGTGMGSFGPGLIMGGLTSTGPLRGLPLTNLTSQFLAGDGVFRIPINPGGTVQSVAVTMTSEFSLTGSPILGSGTIDIGFRQPLAVAHGGTGLGSTGVGAIIKGGLTSTGPLQGLPLTNLTSNFLRGDGIFGVPPAGPGGTVTMVGLTLTSEFNIVPNPVLGSGALAASFAFQSANFIFGGPGTGTPTTPAFRALVNADVPQSMSGKTLTSSVFQNPTVGSQVLTFGSSIKWNMNSGPIGLLGMDSTAVGLMDTPANLPNAGSAVLRIQQLGTGLPNLGFNAIFKFEGGVDPVLSSGFSQVDVITLYLESTAVYGVARKNFR